MTRSVDVALAALVVVACVAVTAVHAAPHERLTLPVFPLPPQRDLALLRMRAPADADAAVVLDADAEEMSDAQVAELPRFRGGAVVAAADADAQTEAETETQTEADADADGEHEQAVAAAGEEESDEIVAATVQAADADADADAEAEEEGEHEAEAEADADAEDEAEAEEPPRFVQPQQQPQMRFARALQRRYDANSLPPGPLPVPASTLQYDLAHAPVQGFPDALPMPLHHSERQFLNAQPVASFAANPNAYAWAGARVQPNYVYGNTLIGAPVNAQFYAPQPQAQPLQPMAAPMPMASAAPAAPAAPVAPETSFLQTAAAMAAAAPQWPASIPRPAAFYLPPDLAI